MDMVNPVKIAKTMWGDAHESVAAYRSGHILKGMALMGETALDAAMFLPVGHVAVDGVKYGARSVSVAGSRFGFFESTGILARERSVAASHIRKARAILAEASIPLSERNKIIKSFELQTFRIERTSKELIRFRTFDDNSAELIGRYAYKNSIENQTARIKKLALPMNSATRLGNVFIPQKSMMFAGKVAPQFRFSDGLIGGEDQIFLLGPLTRYKFHEVMMPREYITYNHHSMTF